MGKSNIIKAIFFANIINATLSIQSIAANKPPAPKGSGGFGDGVVVGGNIDAHIIYYALMGIIYGFWFLNKKVNSMN